MYVITTAHTYIYIDDVHGMRRGWQCADHTIYKSTGEEIPGVEYDGRLFGLLPVDRSHR